MGKVFQQAFCAPATGILRWTNGIMQLWFATGGDTVEQLEHTHWPQNVWLAGIFRITEGNRLESWHCPVAARWVVTKLWVSHVGWEVGKNLAKQPPGERSLTLQVLLGWLPSSGYPTSVWAKSFFVSLCNDQFNSTKSFVWCTVDVIN